MISRSLATVIALSSALVLSPAARAGDVKLLKQPSAFPLVISKSGSYRLKSNITVPDANTTAISIAVDNVTLDLNGYSIIGPTVCSGGPPVTGCTPTGMGAGLVSSNANITVLNGTVQGMGSSGVSLLAPRIIVQNVRAISNGFRGIDVGSESTVTGSIGVNNGDFGISTGGVSVVTSSVATGNASSGIEVQGTSTGVVASSTSERNGGNGFEGGSAFAGNTAQFNGGFGIGSGSQFGYSNNVLFINTFGSVGGGGVDMGNNDCNGSTICP